MPRYGQVWLEIADEQYASLPAEAREQVDKRVEELLENPRLPHAAAYDAPTDQWTTIYGGGIGLIVYAVVHERRQAIILRLV
ncbi:MAG: type II toxin-antitoxin system RelE family toxin [Pseudonocardiaceae bacterium]